MTERDTFAAYEMAGLLASEAKLYKGYPHLLADLAYKIADEMVAKQKTQSLKSQVEEENP
jgi:hypothetical protein